MRQFALTAFGRDRPGIVAALTEALLAVGANIEDSRMAILRGHFAVMLIVSAPEDSASGELRSRLDAVSAELGLEAIALNPVEEVDPGHAEPSHIVSVHGADHPGIVHSIAAALARCGANICDLQTRLTGGGERRVYVMLLEISLGEADAGEVSAALTEAAADADVTVSMRPLEAEPL